MRWCSDGTLLYCGRGDGQIKILGHRVEVGEVQTVVSEHPAVALAACVARGGEDDNTAQSPAQSICCYVVPRPERSAEGATPGKVSTLLARADLRRELRAWCVNRLPRFAVPTAFVFLDELPLTNSMKIDTRRLPPPSRDDYSTSGSQRAVDSSLADGVNLDPMATNIDSIFAVATDAERVVATVWERCIGVLSAIALA